MLHRAAGRDHLPAPVQKIDTTTITLHLIGTVPDNAGVLFWDDPYTGEYRQLEPRKDGGVWHYKFEQYATQKLAVKLGEGGLLPILNPGDKLVAWVDMDAFRRHDKGERVQYVFYEGGSFPHENNILSMEPRMGNPNAFNDSHMTHEVQLPIASVESFVDDVVKTIESKQAAVAQRTDISGAVKEALMQDYAVTGLGAVEHMRTFLQVLGFGRGITMEKNVDKLGALNRLDLNDPLLMYGLNFGYTIPSIAIAYADAGQAAASGWMSWGNALKAIGKAERHEEISTEDRAAVAKAAQENPALGTFFTAILRATQAKIDSAMSSKSYVVHDTPKYDNPANVIDAIAAQYPGKVVLVDLWATWCGPCLAAMRTIKEIKPWIHENDIVSVYITTESSPKARWTLSLPEIGGEHYYITTAEWNAALEKYGFEGIPAYLIFDRNGTISLQQIGYPGNARMKAELEKVL